MTDDQSDPEGDEGVLCPKCLLSNSPAAAFCSDCGAPIGIVSAIDPIQHIYAEGFAYRSAVDGPPKLIIVIGMWLMFFPPLVGTLMLVFLATSYRLAMGLFSLSLAVMSAVILYRVTRNYIVKTRQIKGIHNE